MKNSILCIVALCCGHASGGEVMREARIFKVDALVTPPHRTSVPETSSGDRVTIPYVSEYYGDDRHVDRIGLEHARRVIFAPKAPAESGTSLDSGTNLAALVRTFLGTDSWDNERNSIELVDGKLTVVQTPDVLAQTATLLTALLERRARQFDVAWALVPPAALDAAAAAAGAPADATSYPPELLDRAVAAAGDGAWTWRTTVEEGEVAATRPERRRAALRDYGVNQTGVIPVINPLISEVDNGPGIWVRVMSTPRAERLLLGFSLAHDIAGEAAPPRKMMRGDLELPETGIVAAASTLLVPARCTAVLAELRWPQQTPAPWVLLARVTPVPPPAPTPSPVEIVEVGAYLQAIHLKTARGDDEDLSAPKRASGAEDHGQGGSSAAPFLETARAWLPAALRENPQLRLEISGTGLFVGVLGDAEATGAAARGIRAKLAERFLAETTCVETRLIRASISKESLERIRAGNGLLLPDDWRAKAEPQRETRVLLAGLTRQRLPLRAAMGRSYVADVESVSGGTTFILMESADPIVRWAGTGIDLAVTALPVAGTALVQVDVDGTAYETTFTRTAHMRLERAVAPDGAGKTHLTDRPLDLDLPDQKTSEFRHTVTVPAGRTAFLNAVPDPQDPARMVMLAVQVRMLE